jgi:cytidylate kinase
MYKDYEKYLEYQKSYYKLNKNRIDERNRQRLSNPIERMKHLEYYRNLYYKNTYNIDHSIKLPIKIENNLLVTFI